MVTIRPAVAADLDEVTALLRHQFDDHAISLDPDRLRGAVAKVIGEPALGAILVAVRDGEAVGLAVLAYTFTLEHLGPVAWLDELYVRPERRGAGDGEALLRAALGHARANGRAAVELEVEAGHERVVSLYVRHGFERLGRTRFALRLA